MKRSKNKRRHKWVDRGKKDKVELYDYDCAKCGIRKLKRSTYSAKYHKGGKVYSRAPECEPDGKSRSEQL